MCVVDRRGLCSSSNTHVSPVCEANCGDLEHLAGGQEGALVHTATHPAGGLLHLQGRLTFHLGVPDINSLTIQRQEHPCGKPDSSPVLTSHGAALACFPIPPGPGQFR